MLRTKTPAQFAHEIWPRLVVTAESRGIITRTTLAKRFGIKGQALKNFNLLLVPLESYCRHHALPPLYALIVQRDSDLPGSSDADAPPIDAEMVYAFPWRHRSPMIPSPDDFTATLR